MSRAMMSLVVVAMVASVAVGARTAAREQELRMGLAKAGAAAPPAVCAPEVVEWSCKNANYDADPNGMSLLEIQAALSAQEASVRAFYEAIGVEASQVENIPCADLCAKTVAAIPEDQRPSSSDRGCRTGANGHGDLVVSCDVDLAPGSLSELASQEETKDVPDMGDDVQHGADEEREAPELVEEELSEFSVNEMLRKVSNVFRIYPALSVAIEVRQSQATDDLDKETSEPSGFLQRSESNAFAKGTCNMGALGACSSTGCTSYVDMRQDTCRQYCSRYGYECSTGYNQAGRDACSYDREIGCDQPVYNPRYGKYDGRAICSCAPRAAASRPSGVSGGGSATQSRWEREVQVRSVQAQAYVTSVVRVTMGRSADSTVGTWFGSGSVSSTRSRKKVQKVLNSVDAMLANVDYVYPGDRCKSNTYAYVFPGSPYNKNRQGQYIFYLCDYYMKVDVGEQIETLTHEGSHHQTAYTDDVEGSDGTTAYGRGACKKLARELPDRALNNADSYCYFINDLEAKFGH